MRLQEGFSNSVIRRNAKRFFFLKRGQWTNISHLESAEFATIDIHASHNVMMMYAKCKVALNNELWLTSVQRDIDKKLTPKKMVSNCIVSNTRIFVCCSIFTVITVFENQLKMSIEDFWRENSKIQFTTIEKCLRIYVTCHFIVSSTKLNFVILLIKSIFPLNALVSVIQIFFTIFLNTVI